jgi:hypothetical protein
LEGFPGQPSGQSDQAATAAAKSKEILS